MEEEVAATAEEVMDEVIEDDPVPTAEQVEFAQTTARYEEVLSKCSSSQDIGPLGALDVVDSLNEVEAKIQRLSIHEEMLKEVKVSRLALKLVASDGPHEVFDDLLKEHCANQAKLFDLARDISNEIIAQKKSMGHLLDGLCKYTASLKDDQLKLSSKSSSSYNNSNSNLKLKNTLERQIKEIRFMQICISNIISNKEVDLRKEQTLREILKSIRNPITSIENFL